MGKYVKVCICRFVVMSFTLGGQLSPKWWDFGSEPLYSMLSLHGLENRLRKVVSIDWAQKCGPQGVFSDIISI